MNGPGGEPLLRVEGLRTWFPIRAGLFQRTLGHVRAVDDIDLEIAAGQTLALPVAAGEDHRRQTVRLIDADGTVLAEVAPAFREHHLWSALLLPAALLRPGMALVVTDGGDGFGEWVAVGEPRWIAPPETGGRF